METYQNNRIEHSPIKNYVELVTPLQILTVGFLAGCGWDSRWGKGFDEAILMVGWDGSKVEELL
jgi:hypothetical protein